MNKWLNYNDFSYKQPKGSPRKFGSAKQRAFIDAHEALKASCGKNESIVFIDAVNQRYQQTYLMGIKQRAIVAD